MGEQTALVLMAIKREAGGRFASSSSQRLTAPSTSAPRPLAGSHVKGLPASVLPLHHKHPLSRHGHQQRVFSKDHWRGDTPSPAPGEGREQRVSGVRRPPWGSPQTGWAPKPKKFDSSKLRDLKMGGLH